MHRLLEDVLLAALAELRSDPIDLYTVAFYHDHESRSVSICADTKTRSRQTVRNGNAWSMKYFAQHISEGNLEDAAMFQANVGRSLSRLDAIVVGLRAKPEARTALPALFDLLERHAQCDLGSPGPMVHEIEAIGGHVSELLHSIRRCPVELTVWMANRLLNSNLEWPVRELLLEALREVAVNDVVAERVRESAREFLEFQEKSI